MSLVHSWIQECTQLHEDCHTPPSKLPTRVLHVGHGNPRLHISDGEVASYVALSHRWGQHRPITTIRANLSERTHGIPYEDFPRLFQDAIVLTRALGVEYLWIDSLCIVQDDKQDWEQEAARMADIYCNAFVTISADDAADATEGILGPRDHRAYTEIAIPCPGLGVGETVNVYARIRVPMKPTSINDGSGHMVLPSVAHGTDETRPPRLLDTRGWTFQERFLAPRTLHYTASELAFECREHVRCECSTVNDDARYPKSWLFKNQNGPPKRTGPAAFSWQSLVEMFTKRSLTVDSDRLYAIAGVAAAMHPYLPEDYLIGLWRQELRLNLLWETARGSQSSRNSGDYAPTWSWASVTGPVFTRPDHFTEVTEDIGKWAEVIDVKVSRSGASPYGPGSGSITLRGLVGPATIAPQDIQGSSTLPIIFRSWLGPSVDGIFFPDVTETPEARVGESVSVLVNFRLYQGESSNKFYLLKGLALKSVGGTPGTFRRVGRVSFYIGRLKLKSWKGLKETQVTII